MASVDTQIANYFAVYPPRLARLGKTLRVKLRARLPGLFEIVYVYENQHVLLFTYSPTENGYQGLCSLGLHSDEVHLSFGQGAQLAKADPEKLLQGSGRTVRYVVLESASDLDRPEIAALLAAALKLAKVQLRPGAEGAVVLKAESQRQRASRARATGRATAPRRKKTPAR